MINYAAWGLRAREAARPHMSRVAKVRRSLARLDRYALEAIAEAAISMLDEMSDPDEDCCTAGDDGCGLFMGGELRGAHWGSHWEGGGVDSPIPSYGDDQRDLMGPFGVAFRVE